MSLLFWLASNTYERITNVEQFNILGKDLIFSLCRALRRLLLGARLYPLIYDDLDGNGMNGPWYTGNGLILTKYGPTIGKITTCSYIPVVYSFEKTDATFDGLGMGKLRAIYHANLFEDGLDYDTMFSILIKFLSLQQIDECFFSFIRTLDPWATDLCKKNYMKLTNSLRITQLSRLPPVECNDHIEYIKFNIICYVKRWTTFPELWKIHKRVINNLGNGHLLANIGRLGTVCEIRLSNPHAYDDHLTLIRIFPDIKVTVSKRAPERHGGQRLEIALSKTDSIWLTYTNNVAILRMVLCVAYIDDVTYNNTIQQAIYDVTYDKPSKGEILLSMFSRINYAPKDSLTFCKSVFSTLGTSCPTNEQDIYGQYNPLKHISINNFKVTIFNTNMVINTKISCRNDKKKYASFLDIPRLTSNFVVKKYSVKEPSFTISVFYSDDLCKSGAININISGNLLNFLFAMGCLKCFMPIKSINPVLISNWNSTLDLQGLENQEIVRSGRRDVFWTTNFPSAVSSKRGYNISWFKAATATISKIHGDDLVNQATTEISQILSNRAAIINKTKNYIFTTLEKRNMYQIQTLHKRFLECLFECCLLKQCDTSMLKRLCNRGLFDFSRHIISHTKNKHECALYGYRKCNMVPKILTGTKKTRLDELGRNSNYLAFRKKVSEILQ